MVKELQSGPYTRYRCSLTVPDPSAHSQYSVSVRHLEQGKTIKSYSHSEWSVPCLCMSSQYYRGPSGHPNKHRDLLGVFVSVTFKDLQIFHS